MADKSEVTMKPTLGLTGLTMNAMALIAPGAFLWLTFVGQGTAGATAPGAAGPTATANDQARWHDFHDKFLSYGGPPIPLVRKLMLGEEGSVL